MDTAGEDIFPRSGLPRDEYVDIRFCRDDQYFNDSKYFLIVSDNVLKGHGIGALDPPPGFRNQVGEGLLKTLDRSRHAPRFISQDGCRYVYGNLDIIFSQDTILRPQYAGTFSLFKGSPETALPETPGGTEDSETFA
jgi:hypothetical protein